MAKTLLEWINWHMSYDEETGLFWWKRRKQGRQMKKPVGSLNTEGYRYMHIDGVHFLQHRLVWLLHTGDWPSGVIDHINGVRHDNRIENLRDVDDSINFHNSEKTPSHKESPWPRGITYRHNFPRPWRARIMIRGKSHEKYFATMEEANDWICSKRSEAG
jgi:hypothetical protein